MKKIEWLSLEGSKETIAIVFTIGLSVLCWPYWYIGAIIGAAIFGYGLKEIQACKQLEKPVPTHNIIYWTVLLLIFNVLKYYMPANILQYFR